MISTGRRRTLLIASGFTPPNSGLSSARRSAKPHVDHVAEGAHRCWRGASERPALRRLRSLRPWHCELEPPTTLLLPAPRPA
jgi:hypothetical protein